MKYGAILLLFLSLTICSDDDELVSYELLGDWEWIQSSGGIAGQVNTPESTGETRSLSISTNLYKQYTNSSLTYETQYVLIRAKSVIYGDERELLVTDNDFRHIYDIENDTLKLTGDCYDCFQSIYIRK